MERQKVPQIRKIVRVVPLRILRPKYSDVIENALKKFKEKGDDTNTNDFWRAIRDRDTEFFRKELNFSEDEINQLERDTLFRVGLDNRVLFSYFDFLQEKLMKDYNKIISKLFINRQSKSSFENDLTDEEVEELIEKDVTPFYGAYIGKGIKSVIKSNLGGKFIKSVKIDRETKKVTKLTAINIGLMGLPVAKSDTFPIKIIKTNPDYITFQKSTKENLQKIEDYETGIEYGDLLVQITIPWFKNENKDFSLIKTKEAIEYYKLNGVGKKDLLNINLVLTTYHIRKKKSWQIDGSSQSLVREMANGELEEKWKSFFDTFIKKYGDEGKSALVKRRVNKKSRAKGEKGRELNLDERIKRLYDSIKAKSFPSEINLIPENYKWKLHFSIEIPPMVNDIDSNLYGGIDFGEQNIATLCVKNIEKDDYDFLTIYGNDLLKHAQASYARRRIMRVQDEYKARGHGKSRKTKAQEDYSERMQKLRQKITERLVKQISDFFLWRNKFHMAVCSLRYEDLNTLYKGESVKAKRMRQFINKQQLFNGIERKLKDYNSEIYVNSRYPHYTSRLCSKCGKLNLYFDFLKFRTKNIIIRKNPDGSEIKYMPFFICEFCGWKQAGDKNASANIADKDYQDKLNKEKEFCNIRKPKSKKEDIGEENEEERDYSRRFNRNSFIYNSLKKDNKLNQEKLFDEWKNQLKRKIDGRNKFEPKEYKDRFSYLFAYYQEIIKNESES
nr:CRISPR-associated protein Cas14a.4 [uncultured archaeon]